MRVDPDDILKLLEAVGTEHFGLAANRPLAIETPKGVSFMRKQVLAAAKQANAMAAEEESDI